MNITIVKNTLSEKGYVQLNKRIIQEVGLTAAAVLAFLIDKHGYWEERNELQDDGSFYWIAEEIEERLSLSPHERREAIVILKKNNLLKVTLKGLPQRNFYLIEWDNILSVLSTSKKSNDIRRGSNSERLDVNPVNVKRSTPCTEPKNPVPKNPEPTTTVVEEINLEPETPKEILTDYLAKQGQKVLIEQLTRFGHLKAIATDLLKAKVTITQCKRFKKDIVAACYVSRKNPDWKQWTERIEGEWEVAVKQASMPDRIEEKEEEIILNPDEIY
jgi:hypothetical protein